jgi:hypothetical protein
MCNIDAISIALFSFRQGQYTYQLQEHRLPHHRGSPSLPAHDSQLGKSDFTAIIAISP